MSASSEYEKDGGLSKTPGSAFEEFVATVSALRHPVSGCPWDLEQDHRSLRRFMLEEAYEAAEAMLGADDAHLLEELGDVLLQVVLNAQLVRERGAGTIVDVIEGINAKMIRRHPHVFAANRGERIQASDVKINWEEIKKREKADLSGKRQDHEGIFSSVRSVVPALTQAFKIGKKAKTIDFDWDQPLDVLQQVRSELQELEVEMLRGNHERMERELGDVFFSMAQLARHLGFEPEAVAQSGNSKFFQRFSDVEDLARARGLEIKNLGRGELEKLWLEAKDLRQAK